MIKRFDIDEYLWIHPLPTVAVAVNHQFEGRFHRLIVCFTFWQTCWLITFKRKAES